jgi:alkylation response protein AidB-like acyl-CoA dehydrogenase
MTLLRAVLAIVLLSITAFPALATTKQFTGIGQAEGAVLQLVTSGSTITAGLTDPQQGTVTFQLNRTAAREANGGFTLNGVTFGVHLVQGGEGHVDLVIVPAAAPAAENAAVYSFVAQKPWFLTQ